MVQYTTIVGAACNDVVVVWIDGGFGANADTDTDVGSRTRNATTAAKKRSTVDESFVMVKRNDKKSETCQNS